MLVLYIQLTKYTIAKQTLCSHLVKCVQENRKWYYLVPALVFNLSVILLPPCTVLFCLSSVLSICVSFVLPHLILCLSYVSSFVHYDAQANVDFLCYGFILAFCHVCIAKRSGK